MDLLFLLFAGIYVFSTVILIITINIIFRTFLGPHRSNKGYIATIKTLLQILLSTPVFVSMHNGISLIIPLFIGVLIERSGHIEWSPISVVTSVGIGILLFGIRHLKNRLGSRQYTATRSRAHLVLRRKKK